MTLYTNHCPLCKRLKEMLDEKNISYSVVESVDEMIKMGITKTPMLEVDGEMLGYKEAYNRLLEGVL